jgi:DNA-binding NtrC family response regulator
MMGTQAPSAFLAKPFDLDALVSAVRHALGDI